MLPVIANPDAISGLSASFDIRVRHQSPFTVRISDGRVRVDSPAHGDVDCHIVAAPVALLLVGYGRKSQWSAIAGGKMFTWGRKPWLAFRFVGLFYNP